MDSFSVWPKPYERHALWLALVLPRGFLSRKEIRPELQKGCYRSVFSFLSARCFKVRVPSIRQFRGSQQCGGCSAFLKHRVARIVRHPLVLKSRLRFGPVRRGVLHQFVGVILTGQALTSQQDKAVSTAEDERRH